MANEITMPKLSDTMEEGKILRWLKHEGDSVEPGDVIAEVETDKADMEVEAPAAGTLRDIRVAEGQSAAVGAVIALFSVDGEAAPKAAAEEREPPRSPEPEAPRRVEQKEAPPQAALGPAERPAREAPVPPGRVQPARPAVPLRASPLARRIADERGIDLQRVQGTGPEGRIVRRDVEGAGGAEARGPIPPRTPPSTLPAGRVELSKMRRTVAVRMAEAKREIPHFYVTSEIDMGDALRLVESLQKRVQQRVTVTHVILKAVALALAEHPRVNGRWADGAVEIGDAINIGIAVAVEEGLIVPVVHGCERLSLLRLAAEAQAAVGRAREGRPTGDDLIGGTFSVSNMGMLDIEEFSAVINPPQAAILAVGAVKERAVARRGKVVVATTMRVTLSSDHRQLNGIEAGRFLETLKGILENPVALVID